MLTLVNNQFLDKEQRLAILNRAVNSQVFFNLLEFDNILGSTASGRANRYGAKVVVNKDFYLTEIKGNFNDIRNMTVGATFNGSYYIANTGESIVRYFAGELLPTAFNVTDVRSAAYPSPASRRFEDKQREFLPKLIKKGDAVVAKIQNVGTIVELAEGIQNVLSGYYLAPETYLNSDEVKRIDESLASQIRYDQWSFNVELEGNQNYTFTNDRTPRLILGFGIVNFSGEAVAGDLTITDVYRQIKFNNRPIPMQFFAPQNLLVQDVNMYYLPIEHYWQAFSPLRLELEDVALVDDLAANGFQFVMLTRTI